MLLTEDRQVPFEFILGRREEREHQISMPIIFCGLTRLTAKQKFVRILKNYMLEKRFIRVNCPLLNTVRSYVRISMTFPANYDWLTLRVLVKSVVNWQNRVTGNAISSLNMLSFDSVLSLEISFTMFRIWKCQPYWSQKEIESLLAKSPECM